MTGISGVISEIVSYLYGALVEGGAAFGKGLASILQGIFLTVSESGDITGLSAFGAIAVVFAGISLLVGLTRWVLGFVTSLGARNR